MKLPRLRVAIPLLGLVLAGVTIVPWATAKADDDPHAAIKARPPEMTIRAERTKVRPGETVQVCYELPRITVPALIEWTTTTRGGDDLRVVATEQANSAGDCRGFTFEAAEPRPCVRARVYQAEDARVVNGMIEDAELLAASQVCMTVR